MRSFQIYFFRKNNNDGKRQEQVNEEMLNFFQYQNYFKMVESDNEKVVYEYAHPRLPYSFVFVLTASSVVPNLHKINPAYIDVRCHAEIDVSVPDYAARHFLGIIHEFSERFSFSATNVFLTDVEEIDLDSYIRIFQALKEYCLENDTMFAAKYYHIAKAKMEAILRYLDEKENLESFYSNADYAVPKYNFLKTDDQKIKCAIDWYDGQATIFPPYIDFVYFRTGELIWVYDANELYDVLEDYLEAVPGFIKEARLISKVNIKKAVKALKKSKIEHKLYQFRSADLNELVD